MCRSDGRCRPLLDQLAALATRQPVLALYEDVHWIDPSRLELLGVVIERIRELPVLVLITFGRSSSRVGAARHT
jgi:predicted ATPase